MAPRGDRRDSGPRVERGSILWAGGSCRAWGTRRGSRNPGARSGGGAAATCTSAARGWRARAPCGLRRSNPAAGPAWMARGQQEPWGEAAEAARGSLPRERRWELPPATRGALAASLPDAAQRQNPRALAWLSQPLAPTPQRERTRVPRAGTKALGGD